MIPTELYFSTDHHYSNKVDRATKFSESGPRFFQETVGLSSGDLKDFVDWAGTQSGNTILVGGDLLDSDGRDVADDVETILSGYTGDVYRQIGNWELGDYNGDPDAYFAALQMGSRSPETIIYEPTDLVKEANAIFLDKNSDLKAFRYYGFLMDDGDYEVLGIVLDSTGLLDGDAGTADTYNDGSEAVSLYVPYHQRAWLTATLADNSARAKPRPVLVFHHDWLAPDKTSVNGYYNSENASAVSAIIEADSNVLGVFQGHHHPGSLPWWTDRNPTTSLNRHAYRHKETAFPYRQNGMKYFCCRSMVCGWGTDPYNATVNKHGVEDDTAGWTEADPATAYYTIQVGKWLNNKFEVRVIGHGNNPSDPGSYGGKYGVF